MRKFKANITSPGQSQLPWHTKQIPRSLLWKSSPDKRRAFQPPYQAGASGKRNIKWQILFLFSCRNGLYIFLTAASQKMTSSDRSQQSRFTHQSGRSLLWQSDWLRNWVHQLGRAQLRLAKSGLRVPVGVSSLCFTPLHRQQHQHNQWTHPGRAPSPSLGICLLWRAKLSEKCS